MTIRNGDVIEQRDELGIRLGIVTDAEYDGYFPGDVKIEYRADENMPDIVPYEEHSFNIELDHSTVTIWRDGEKVDA